MYSGIRVLNMEFNITDKNGKVKNLVH